MNIATTAHLGGRIIEALGLNLKYVKSINIDLDVDRLICCTVEFYPDIVQADSFANVLETEMKRYTLVELQQSDVSQRTD